MSRKGMFHRRMGVRKRWCERTSRRPAASRSLPHHYQYGHIAERPNGSRGRTPCGNVRMRDCPVRFDRQPTPKRQMAGGRNQVSAARNGCTSRRSSPAAENERAPRQSGFPQHERGPARPPSPLARSTRSFWMKILPVCHKKTPWSNILYEKSYKITPGNDFLDRFV